MPTENPKYDVAISFLASDESIAASLFNKLNETQNVFFFPHNQEELAGTDGMESMRKPFLEECRVMVILFREQWGKTRWTAIEEAAIKEACFNGEWKRLFFVALDRTSILPTWLPPYYVRYNWEDFGLDQAVGAIKARVFENGGQPVPLTPVRKAELLRAENLYRMAVRGMSSEEGLNKISDKVKELLEEIGSQCEEVKAHGYLNMEYEINFVPGGAHQACILREVSVSMIVIWHQQYANTLANSGLSIQEYNGRLLFNKELQHLLQVHQPKKCWEAKYEPSLSRSGDYGWKPISGSEAFISSADLARKAILLFMELIGHAANGELEGLDSIL